MQFNDWCVDVRKGFLQWNCIALPVDVLANNGCNGLNKIQVDARSFLTQMNALTRAYVAMSNHVVSVGEDLQQVIDWQDRMNDRQDKLEQLLTQLVDTKMGHDEHERLAYSELCFCASTKDTG